MVTLITGATGFVGSAIARACLRRGDTVRALVRPGSDRRNLDGLGVELVEGDITDPASLAQAIGGCDRLFHAAADYRLWVPDAAAMIRTNVDGTRLVMEAALAAGVARVVYTSSIATIGLTGDGSPANEDTPSTVDDMIGPYKRSKFLAERIVDDLVRRRGLPAVIVNPAAPVGPGDIKPTPTGALIADAVAGRMPAYVDTGLNIVHVDDVAAGHLLAAELGAVGRRYILGGENLTLHDMLTRLAGLTGRRPPRLRLPHAVASLLARVEERRARLFGGTPRATVDGTRMARKPMFFTSARAMRELGYRPRAVDDALADAAAWYCRRGR